MGFPLIRIRLEDRIVRVSQERFTMNPFSRNNTDLLYPIMQLEESEYRWFVPLSYITDLQPKTAQFVWINKTFSCKSGFIIRTNFSLN